MFWINFYSLCEKRNLKPLQVVKELGIASGSITNWKNGVLPSSKNLKKLAEYFGVKVEYFFIDHSDLNKTAKELTTDDTLNAAQKASPSSRDGIQLSPFERELLSEYRRNPAFSAIVDAAFYAIHPRQTEDVSS